MPICQCGKPSHAYVYLFYGNYWLLKVFCRPGQQPTASPRPRYQAARGHPSSPRTAPASRRGSGPMKPGRLTMALAVTNIPSRADLMGGAAHPVDQAWATGAGQAGARRAARRAGPARHRTLAEHPLALVGSEQSACIERALRSHP
jgi:3-methyladenine DNA glycosylase Mpg